MLETQRTRLRNLRKDDVESLYRFRNDKRCSQYQRYQAMSREALEGFVRTFENAAFPSLQEEQHYAVVLAKTQRMIGDVSIFFSEKDRCFTFGITIAPEYQRQGYAFEVLHALSALLRARYPEFDQVALIEKENAASIALFRRLGFLPECYADSIKSWVYVKPGAPEDKTEAPHGSP